jgi:hypothetical protein
MRRQALPSPVIMGLRQSHDLRSRGCSTVRTAERASGHQPDSAPLCRSLAQLAPAPEPDRSPVPARNGRTDRTRSEETSLGQIACTVVTGCSTCGQGHTSCWQFALDIPSVAGGADGLTDIEFLSAGKFSDADVSNVSPLHGIFMGGAASAYLPDGVSSLGGLGKADMSMTPEDGARMEAARRYLLPHERWLTDRLLGWERASPMLDVAGHEQKEGAESFRLGRATSVDELLAIVIGLVGAGVMAITAVTHELGWVYAGLCIMGFAFVSVFLAGIRQIQSMRARREYRRINSHLIGR